MLGVVNSTNPVPEYVSTTSEIGIVCMVTPEVTIRPLTFHTVNWSMPTATMREGFFANNLLISTKLTSVFPGPSINQCEQVCSKDSVQPR